ncbi:S-methyl-5-thioribose-1-phosphate isomerase [Candidatus Falkowbacteria bacterium]|nr:S-methyl-5-thioribose-1-phosphate isomerase [Candidatus Falkowbacteria bacterium]
MHKIIERTFRDIKAIKIQGATNVALAVAQALKKTAKDSAARTRTDFMKEIADAGHYLLSARLTEPMADNAAEFILFQLNKNKTADVKELIKVAGDAADYFLDLMDKNNQKITAFGEKLVKFGDKIFTHCHASTVIKILLAAKRSKKRFEVFQTETRPLYQGHKTAIELLKYGIKDTLVADSAAPYLISKVSGPKFEIDKVIIGCDAISRDGACVNKVGSFGLALSAFLNKVPVYVAAQALKINEDAKNLRAIKIEERSAREVWDRAPKDLRIYNPAFDRVPAELITDYICEFGILTPDKLISKIKENYRWLW